MKIVYCLPSTYLLGGVERIISSKANLFAEMGHDVSIITTDQQGKQPYFKINNKVNAERKSKVDDNTAKMQSIKWLGV